MMANFKDKWESLEEKKRQTIRAVLVVLLISLLAVVIQSVRTDNKKLYEKKETKIDFSDVKSKGNLQNDWRERSEMDIKELKDAIAEEKKSKEDLQNKLDNLTTQIDESTRKNQEQLQAQIEQLNKQNNEKKLPNKSGSRGNLGANNDQGGHSINDPFARAGGGDVNSMNNDGELNGHLNLSGGNDDGSFDQGESYPENRQIDLVNFYSDHEKKSFSLDDYLPAGSYVKAVLISAVDASVGISSQSDPRPVLFRIVSEAKSVVDKNKQLTTNIKGCIVTGAASADLSSERAYTRLLKMTCPNGNGEVIETDVEGYAADGSDGKAGLVGRKITREGDLLAKSFFVGLVGGSGQGLSDKVAPPLAFSNGLTTQGTLSTEDVVKRGLGKGISSGADRLSNYMIDRAEQYQPVIAISSGKEAELVFISGVYLDGRKKAPKQVETKK